ALDGSRGAIEALDRCGAGVVSDGERQRMVAGALAAMGGDARDDRLEALAHSPDPAVRAAAVESLGKSAPGHSRDRPRLLLRGAAAEEVPPPLSPSEKLDPPAESRLRFATEKGAFVIALAREEAPATTRALADLARSGFYDGLRFHRVVPDFVVQGGDPRGDG